MVRKLGFNLPGVPQHVIQRGNNRESCFYEQDDYYRYLYDLEDAAKNNNCVIHAYVLMTNQIY
jgi:putative transposase